MAAKSLHRKSLRPPARADTSLQMAKLFSLTATGTFIHEGGQDYAASSSQRTSDYSGQFETVTIRPAYQEFQNPGPSIRYSTTRFAVLIPFEHGHRYTAAYVNMRALASGEVRVVMAPKFSAA